MSSSQDILGQIVNQRMKSKGGFGRKGAEEHATHRAALKRAQDQKQAQEQERIQTALNFMISGTYDDDAHIGDAQARTMVKAMIAATKADGVLDDHERDVIFSRFHDLDGDDMAFIKSEIEKPLNIHEIVDEVDGLDMARNVYVASCLAIDLSHEAERRYLDDLAELLHLPSDQTKTLESQVNELRANTTGHSLPNSSINEWFFVIDDQQEGPMHFQLAARFAHLHPDALCWREGFSDWQPVSQTPELDTINAPVFRYTGKDQIADEVDFKIFGQEMQFVEIELDQGESAIGEPGAMMYKDPRVSINALFGDGTGQDSTVLKKLIGAGKRVLSGEGLFLSVFSNQAPQKSTVAFASSFPGTIIPLKLDHYGGHIICQQDAFLAAAKGVSIGIHARLKVMFWVFGGEGMILQKLSGDGWAFMHAGGTVVERNLGAGETLDVDSGSLVAFTDTVQYDVQLTGGIKSILFSGEGLTLVQLRGPGKVWLQSLPFSRLAGRLFGLWEKQSRKKSNSTSINFD